jgi:hypothetical protein
MLHDEMHKEIARELVQPNTVGCEKQPYLSMFKTWYESSN